MQARAGCGEGIGANMTVRARWEAVRGNGTGCAKLDCQAAPGCKAAKGWREPTATVFLREASIPPEESLRFPGLTFRDGILFWMGSSLKCWQGRRNDDDPSNQCAGMWSVMLLVLGSVSGRRQHRGKYGKGCVEKKKKTIRKVLPPMTNRTPRPRKGFVMT